MSEPSSVPQPATEPRAANRRTGLTLLSVALVFFGGVIAAQFTGGTTIGIVVLGFGIVGFLFVAVERARK